jgi:hypothetical protein
MKMIGFRDGVAGRGGEEEGLIGVYNDIRVLGEIHRNTAGV